VENFETFLKICYWGKKAFSNSLVGCKNYKKISSADFLMVVVGGGNLPHTSIKVIPAKSF